MSPAATTVHALFNVKNGEPTVPELLSLPDGERYNILELADIDMSKNKRLEKKLGKDINLFIISVFIRYYRINK